MDGHILGVALEIPSPWAEQLRAARAGYGDPDAHRVPPHITVVPPTTVDAVVLPEILDHLHRVAATTTPFEVLLRGTGSFRPVSPVVFVAVSQGIAACEALERRVRSGPLERPLAFPYHPHVTVAHDVGEDVLDRAFADLSGFTAQFRVDSVRLYRHVAGEWQTEHDLAFGESPL